MEQSWPGVGAPTLPAYESGAALMGQEEVPQWGEGGQWERKKGKSARLRAPRGPGRGGVGEQTLRSRERKAPWPRAHELTGEGSRRARQAAHGGPMRL